MNTIAQSKLTAEFNPNIKIYILLYVALILLVTIVGIPFLIFWFLGLGQYFGNRYYVHLKCELTERHLIFKKGVLFKIEKTIPLENIQDLTFLENPLTRIFGLQVLKIETAGQSNPQGSDMKLIGIVNPGEFKNAVLKQRELVQKYNKSENITQETNQVQVNSLLTEIRDILIEIKNK